MPHRNNRHLTQQLVSSNSLFAPPASVVENPIPQQSHPQRAQTPPIAPPLITDTLTACLDVNGTYICTSYSPRCYIIQKVAPNSLTVTPANTSTTVPPPPNFFYPVRTSTFRAISGSSHKSGNNQQQQSGLELGEGSNDGTSTSAAATSVENAQQVQTYQQGQTGPLNASGGGVTQEGEPLTHTHPQHGSGSCSRVSGGRGWRRAYKHHNRKVPQTLSKFERTASPSSGGIYMNGEIGSSIRPVGETGMLPTMVYSQPGTTLIPSQSGPHYSDPHIMNGMIMPQDLYGEAVEHLEGADTKRGFNSQDVTTGQPVQQGHAPDLPISELKRMLLIQLEYYFSPENLAVDKYLVTQMDQDHYVPIATLATFNMVKKLTSDIDLVTEVLRESKNVQVHADGKRVRPISHRTVVILRGIPSSTSAEEIQNLFENENCPKCTGCEFAFNDSWYVSFESDDDAMQAHRYLREDVREFKGHPIMARIKSKPTTLLSQGVAIGVPSGMKNGYAQPGAMMQSYMASAPPFVPANQQTGPTTAPASLYAPGHQVHQNVFPGVLPSNYAQFSPWPGYFEMNSAGLSMFSLNGLQSQGNSGYGKSAPMNPRSRNLNPIRGVGPKRTISSSSDTQVVSGTGNNNSNGLQHQQQPYNTQPPRKNNGASAPAPLLGMAPQSLAHPHNNSNHHSVTHNSLHNSSNQSTNGARHYNNSYSQNLPHVDSFHYNRSYRGSGESRPRSSMSSRRGPPRREEEYEYTPTSNSSNYRGNPSTRSVPPVAVSPQIPVQVAVVTNQNHQIDLDLEGAFPPLPGSTNSSNKSEDFPYEGRLSDVVKGFNGGENREGGAIREDFNEIIVSAAEQPGSSASSGSPGEVVVSAASPQKDESNDISSHFKKEYREIGVGSADEHHDIRSTGKPGVVSGLRQMADKSTRTDENLLNGDQQPSAGRGSQTQPQQYQSSGNNGGYRKSVTSQGGGSKSPIPSKRGVPPFQTVSEMGVGPDVPYTSSYSSPSKSTRSASATVKPQHPDNNRAGGSGTDGSIIITANSNSIKSQISTGDKDAFPTPNFCKVPIPASAKPFSGVTDHNPKETPRNEDERKESGQGDGKKTEDCSNDGPVRLSYAQVAQSRKDSAHQSSSGSSSNPTSTSAAGTQPNSPAQSFSSSGAQSLTHQDERKGRNSKDKDTRAQSRNQRGNGDRDQHHGRERGYRNRGGPRSRVTSDASETGSNSGASRPTRDPRSPK